jgi:Protein of unknown function (DUF3551)
MAMTTIRAAVFTLLALTMLAAIDSRPVAAEVYRPWCVQYTGGNGDDGTTCTFASYEQCMLTARGTGAYCVQNPWYLKYGGGQDEQKVDRSRRR